MHACIGEGNGNPLQYSCLENPRDRGAWLAAVYGVPQSRAQLKQLSNSSSGTWNLPGPGIEPESSLLAGGFLTTRPPTKSKTHFWCYISQTVLPNFQVGLNAFSPSVPQVYPKFLYFYTYGIMVRVIYVSYSNCETMCCTLLYSQDPVIHRMQSKPCAKYFLHSVSQDTLTTWLNGQSPYHHTAPNSMWFSKAY